MPSSADTRSTLAVKHWPPAPDRTPTILCLACGDAMKQRRIIPKLGLRPELLIFVCPSCKEVEAKEGTRFARVTKKAHPGCFPFNLVINLRGIKAFGPSANDVVRRNRRVA